MPASYKFEIGDMIYVAETKYGIWSKGEISEISQVVELNNTSEVVQYINSTSGSVGDAVVVQGYYKNTASHNDNVRQPTINITEYQP